MYKRTENTRHSNTRVYELPFLRSPSCSSSHGMGYRYAADLEKGKGKPYPGNENALVLLARLFRLQEDCRGMLWIPEISAALTLDIIIKYFQNTAEIKAAWLCLCLPSHVIHLPTAVTDPSWCAAPVISLCHLPSISLLFPWCHFIVLKKKAWKVTLYKSWSKFCLGNKGALWGMWAPWALRKSYWKKQFGDQGC